MVCGVFVEKKTIVSTHLHFFVCTFSATLKIICLISFDLCSYTWFAVIYLAYTIKITLPIIINRYSTTRISDTIPSIHDWIIIILFFIMPKNIMCQLWLSILSSAKKFIKHIFVYIVCIQTTFSVSLQVFCFVFMLCMQIRVFFVFK